MIATLHYLFVPVRDSQEPPPVKLSAYEEIVAKLTVLATTRAKQVYSSDLSITKVYVYRKTIWEYSDLLRILVSHFETGAQIPLGLVAKVDTPVYIRDFFRDRDNNFVDPQETMLYFTEQVKQFLQLYEKMEMCHDKPFAVEKNLYLTAPIVSNLSSLSQGF